MKQKTILSDFRKSLMARADVAGPVMSTGLGSKADVRNCFQAGSDRYRSQANLGSKTGVKSKIEQRDNICSSGKQASALLLRQFLRPTLWVNSWYGPIRHTILSLWPL